MPILQAPERKYNFSDGRLIEVAEEKIAFAQRDVADLTPLGIDAAWILNFQNVLNAFVALPSDETELGEQEQATEEKNEDAESLRDTLRDLRTAAQRVFGDKSPKYKQFGLMEMSTFSDAELLRRAYVARAVATTYVADLTPKGFDAAAITLLDGKIATYVAGIQNKALEVGSRDIAQENRVNAGNALYALLEDDLCAAGKNYYQTRSAAKYNDYLIHHTTQLQIDNGTILHESILEVNVTVNSPSDFITLAIPAGGQTLKIYCSANDNDPPTGLAATVVNGTTWSGRASDLGWSNTNRRLLLANETLSDSGYQVTVL